MQTVAKPSANYDSDNQCQCHEPSKTPATSLHHMLVQIVQLNLISSRKSTAINRLRKGEPQRDGIDLRRMINAAKKAIAHK